jgi:MazG family protein
LVAIMARLRGPGGCPWDREQDHRSLRPHLLEEAYEVLEAVDAEDAEALRQELGDVLLQVVFHAQLAAEAGAFDISDVIRGLREKLIARHPHVFGDKQIETAEGVVTQWERIKREERQQTPEEQVVEGVPKSLPALARAQAALRKAARAGLERTREEAAANLGAAVARVEDPQANPAALEEAVGELLFAVADLARSLGVEAEQALRERVDGFLREFSPG